MDLGPRILQLIVLNRAWHDRSCAGFNRFSSVKMLLLHLFRLSTQSVERTTRTISVLATLDVGMFIKRTRLSFLPIVLVSTQEVEAQNKVVYGDSRCWN